MDASQQLVHESFSWELCGQQKQRNGPMRPRGSPSWSRPPPSPGPACDGFESYRAGPGVSSAPPPPDAGRLSRAYPGKCAHLEAHEGAKSLQPQRLWLRGAPAGAHRPHISNAADLSCDLLPGNVLRGLPGKCPGWDGISRRALGGAGDMRLRRPPAIGQSAPTTTPIFPAPTDGGAAATASATSSDACGTGPA